MSATSQLGQPDAYSGTLTHISQTITVADALITLVREPVMAILQNVNKDKALKASVGEWKGEAFKGNGCGIPSLETEPFEDYLVAHDGAFEPTGECTATAGWPHLLHALGIKPGMNVLDWGPVTDGYIPLRNGGMTMEIGGKVFCHIINIYRVPPEATHSVKILQRCIDMKACVLPFGQLAWTKLDSRTIATFKPKGRMHMNSKRTPFGNLMQHLGSKTVVNTYFNALEFGVSNTQLAWPVKGSMNIRDQMKRLVSNVREVQTTTKPLLLTYRWLNKASILKSKVLSRNNKDQSFLDDILETVEAAPELDRLQKRGMRERISEYFMFDQVFKYGIGESDITEPTYPVSPQDMVKRTLDGYSSLPQSQWKHELYTLAEQVKDVIFLEPIIILNDMVRVLDFGDVDEMWSETVQL
jgi:hypothetical protein